MHILRVHAYFRLVFEIALQEDETAKQIVLIE